MRDCQSVRRPRQGDQAARGATKRCIPQRWITDRTRRVKVRVWLWEAESAFMEATQILSSCCRLSLGIVQPCAGCRLSRSCISRIWISRTRAGPGQAAPPRGAAGAPPRPPCREGSWISRRRKRAGEVRCARRVRPLSPPRTRLATALAAKDGRETSILSTLRSRSTSRDSGPEADYPHPGSTAGEPAPSRAYPAWARLASGTVATHFVRALPSSADPPSFSVTRGRRASQRDVSAFAL